MDMVRVLRDWTATALSWLLNSPSPVSARVRPLFGEMRASCDGQRMREFDDHFDLCVRVRDVIQS
jgi:hypothetical protein